MGCPLCELIIENERLKAEGEAEKAAGGGCYIAGFLDEGEKITVTIYGTVSDYHRIALLDLIGEIDKTTRRA
jgi:hypothetical protein